MPDIKLHSFENATEYQIQFANSGIQWLKDVVNNEEFLKKIRHTTFTRRRFCTDTGAYIEASNPFILKIIAYGKERSTQPDNTIDLMVKVAPLSPTVVGRIIPPDPLITTNILFFERWMNKNDSLSLAAHWMHEWLHVAGFRHVKLANGGPDRRDVNYTIGRYVVEVGRQNAIKDAVALAVVKDLGKGYLDSALEHLSTVEEN